MLKTISALAALAAASALVAPTVSQAEEPNSVRVSYADLNLASDLGQQTLQRRIANGARTVCVIEDSRNSRSPALPTLAAAMRLRVRCRPMKWPLPLPGTEPSRSVRGPR